MLDTPRPHGDLVPHTDTRVVQVENSPSDWHVVPADFGSGVFRIDVDGKWYHDGIAIDRPELVRLFAQGVARNAAGDFVLRWGHNDHRLLVADTPVVIRSVGVPTATGQCHGELVDGRSVQLDASALAVGANNVLYARMPDGEWARFGRTAYYQMAQWIVDTPKGFCVTNGKHTWPIGQKEAGLCDA